MKAGIVADLESADGTAEVLRIVVGKKFMLLPLKKQAEIAITICGFAGDEEGVDTCPVVRNGVGLGRVDVSEDGPAVVWETWYQAEQARRDFARAN